MHAPCIRKLLARRATRPSSPTLGCSPGLVPENSLFLTDDEAEVLDVIRQLRKTERHRIARIDVQIVQLKVWKSDNKM